MSEKDKFTITPLGQSVYFAYVQAYANKHNISHDEAIILLSKKEVKGLEND